MHHYQYHQQYSNWMQLVLFVCLMFLVSTTACPEACSCTGSILAPIVDCSNQDLSTIPIPEIDSNTEILKLSDNRISRIERNTFSTLVELEEIYLSRNSLRKIDKGTFSDLKYLSFIDLSNNFLENIDPEMFSKNSYLQTIILRGNELLSVSAYFIRSPAVIRLDLSYCRIKNLPNNTFDDMTSLRFLYLRGNQLSALGMGLFNKLDNLKVVDLAGNSWPCSNCELLDQFSNLYENRKIEMKKPKCSEPQNVAGAFPWDAKKIICPQNSNIGSDQVNINGVERKSETVEHINEQNSMFILNSVLLGSFNLLVVAAIVVAAMIFFGRRLLKTKKSEGKQNEMKNYEPCLQDPENVSPPTGYNEV